MLTNSILHSKCETANLIFKRPHNIIINSEKPNYKEPPIDISFFAYKRQNHFVEWLAQFQAKESTEIPEELMGEHPPIDMFDDDTPICSPDCTCEACACSLENPEACEACQ